MPPTVPLHMNAYVCGVRFIALVLYGFLNGRAECLLVCTFWYLAMAANYLFADGNSNQPIRLALIPGDFYPIRTHGYLRLEAI